MQSQGKELRCLESQSKFIYSLLCSLPSEVPLCLSLTITAAPQIASSENCLSKLSQNLCTLDWASLSKNLACWGGEERKSWNASFLAFVWWLLHKVFTLELAPPFQGLKMGRVQQKDPEPLVQWLYGQGILLNRTFLL